MRHVGPPAAALAALAPERPERPSCPLTGWQVTGAGAGATAAVDVTVDGPDVLVEVVDDGHGAAHTSTSGGLGLVGMRERVAVHGGTLDVGPAPGGGWRVRARIPR